MAPTGSVRPAPRLRIIGGIGVEKSAAHGSPSLLFKQAGADCGFSQPAKPGVSPCRRWPIPSIIFLGLQIARHLRFAALWVAHSFRAPPPPASYPATALLWQSQEMIARTVSAALCSLEQLFRFNIVEKILAALMRIGGGLPYPRFRRTLYITPFGHPLATIRQPAPV
jgi:hypothetical protein